VLHIQQYRYYNTTTGSIVHFKNIAIETWIPWSVGSKSNKGLVVGLDLAALYISETGEIELKHS